MIGVKLARLTRMSVFYRLHKARCALTKNREKRASSMHLRSALIEQLRPPKISVYAVDERKNCTRVGKVVHRRVWRLLKLCPLVVDDTASRKSVARIERALTRLL